MTEPGPADPPGSAVSIRPSRALAVVAVVGAVLVAVLALAAGLGAIAQGRVGSGLVSLVGGLGVAVMSFDVSRRSVEARGDVLEVRQWFRTITLERDDIFEFVASRASLFRWDVVAVRDEGPQVRLWVTRMITAGRARRTGWLDELEAWRMSD